MKILVFDDSLMNQRSARVQLKDHDLTIVGTYDEAQSALTSMKFGKVNPDFQKFDVVLTDLMVPASRQSLGGPATQLAGQEMPLGSIIALKALSVGVKMVALVTDTNHHDHPASAAIDTFDGRVGEPAIIGDARLFCTNYDVNGLFDAETFEQLDKFQNHGERKTLYAKDWAKALRSLMK